MHKENVKFGSPQMQQTVYRHKHQILLFHKLNAYKADV